MPRTKEQYEQIREERRVAILKTALKLFSEVGYDRTTISMLAKEAGISKGLLYNYYKSKEDVLSSIIIRSMGDLSQFFDPNHDGVLTDEEVGFLIDAVFDQIRENIVFWRLLLSLMLQPSVIQTSMKELMKFFEPMFGILSAYLKNKGFPNPDNMVRLFAATLDGVAMHYIMDPEHFPVDFAKKTLKHQFIKNHK